MTSLKSFYVETNGALTENAKSMPLCVACAHADLVAFEKELIHGAHISLIRSRNIFYFIVNNNVVH
jgi:hypothetical protein